MTNIVQSLITKRAEMAGEIKALQMRVRQMLIDLDALDSTIRVFQPDIDLEEVRPKQLPPRHAGYRGRSGAEHCQQDCARQFRRCVHGAMLYGDWGNYDSAGRLAFGLPIITPT